MHVVIGYQVDAEGRWVKQWSENTPAEPAWGHALSGSRIVEQPGRSPEETRLRAEKAAQRRAAAT